MTQSQIDSSPEWQAKQAAEQQRIIEQQEQLNATAEEKRFNLHNLIPTFTQVDKKEIFLSPDEKNLVIAYSFIGLSELVSASSGQTLEYIWNGCISRAIHNLKKDGLIR
jgi:hypothetical protein